MGVDNGLQENPVGYVGSSNVHPSHFLLGFNQSIMFCVFVSIVINGKFIYIYKLFFLLRMIFCLHLSWIELLQCTIFVEDTLTC